MCSRRASGPRSRDGAGDSWSSAVSVEGGRACRSQKPRALRAAAGTWSAGTWLCLPLRLCGCVCPCPGDQNLSPSVRQWVGHLISGFLPGGAVGILSPTSLDLYHNKVSLLYLGLPLSGEAWDHGPARVLAAFLDGHWRKPKYQDVYRRNQRRNEMVCRPPRPCLSPFGLLYQNAINWAA